MPDRIIRAELLTSEAWLSLKNNDDRVCWLVLFLNADTFGNQPAGPYRIIHLCRHAGIDTPEKAAKVLTELADADLIRCYQADGKPYVHIPRYNQSRRFLGRLWPVPDWSTNEEKQAFTNKSQVNHKRPQVTHGEPPEGVGVGVGVKTKTTTRVPRQPPAGVDALIALGVDTQVAHDWMAVRKAKRAPLTQTVIATLQREAAIAKISVAEAVRIAASRNWQQFSAAWITSSDIAPGHKPSRMGKFVI